MSALSKGKRAGHLDFLPLVTLDNPTQSPKFRSCVILGSILALLFCLHSDPIPEAVPIYEQVTVVYR